MAIVTGASGGIGEATARALHAAGYRVFGTSRRPPATRSPGIEYLACDVTSDESVQAAVGEVLSKAGRIDLLVNNAGVGLVAGAEESSLEQAKSLFDVNLFGADSHDQGGASHHAPAAGRDGSSISARSWA